MVASKFRQEAGKAAAIWGIFVRWHGGGGCGNMGVMEGVWVGLSFDG